MRKHMLFGYMLVAFVLLGAVNVDAQKLGYVNPEEILAEMPAVKQANSRLEALGEQLQKQYTAEAQKFQAAYQSGLEKAQKGELSPLQQQELEAKLQKMQSDLVALERKIQQDLLKKENELLNPILEQVNSAIQQVAKEKGFTNVVNSQFLIVKDPSGDITAGVKKKLNIQ